MKRMKWRTRMILLSITAVSVLSFAITAISSKVREHIFHDYICDLLKPLSSMVVSHMEHCMFSHTATHFQEFLADLQGGEEIRSIRVLNRDGAVVFSTRADEIGSVDSVFVTRIRDKPLEDFRVVTSGTKPLIHHAYTLTEKRNQCLRCHQQANAKQAGYLGISFTYAKHEHSQRELMLYDYFGFSGLLLISAVVLILVHGRVFQDSFGKILRGVDAIKAGDLGAQVPVPPRGEMRRLAEGINEMSNKLRNAMKVLGEMHQKEIDRAGQLATVGELAASVAHEIKNPVAGIANTLDILISEDTDLQDRDILFEMRAQTVRITKTIEDLLAFARPKEPMFAETDVHEVLSKVVGFRRKQLAGAGMMVTEEYGAATHVVRADAELLEQLFVNLLINASQACIHGTGQIAIKTACDPASRELRITVIDNGIGIPPHQVDQVFKPFFTTKHKGTGLGLSLCKSIIARHNGRIEISSKEGEGTQVNIVLPTPGAPSAPQREIPDFSMETRRSIAGDQARKP